jgi:phosphotransferase system enzyme I (PtsI)
MGIGVSPGIASGPVRIVHWEFPKVTRRLVSRDEVESEVQRLQEAVRLVGGTLKELRDQTARRAGAKAAEIFEAQILMLEDPEFTRDVETLIRENQLSAERAFEFKTLEMRALWAQSTNARLRQRVADLAGIQLRVLNQLMGRSVTTMLQAPDERPVIVFTREITPGLLVQFGRERVAGIATEEGTRASHAAILARGMGIPCVMGLVGAMERLRPGIGVVLDGTHGAVLIDPTAQELEQARESERLRVELSKRLEGVAPEPASTVDGHRLTLRGNVDMPDDLETASAQGAEGVGLLRTEFLLLGRHDMPSEEEQVEFFERAAREFPSHAIVVRSYDLGGDKFPAMFTPAPEPNPFLGWRAIRVCLDHPEYFRTQIRALARARCAGDLQLMLPLVTQVEEIERVRELVSETLDELRVEGVPAATELPVGVMIETPAAAVQAEDIARRCDFLSVGTNDLTQYTLAVDRGNARLAGRFAPHHPAILRLLKRVVEAGRSAGHQVSVCGEMASDPKSVFLLLGLGFDVLSVSPSALPFVRWTIRQVAHADAARVADAALALATTRDVAMLLDEALGKLVDLDLIDAGRLPAGYGAASLNRAPGTPQYTDHP